MTDFAIRRSPSRAPCRDGTAPAGGSRAIAHRRRRGLAAAFASWALALVVGTHAQAQAVGTPPGTPIRNVATATLERGPGLVESVASNEVAVVAVPARSRATVQWLRATADGPGTPTPIGATSCRAAGGDLVPLPPPQLIGGEVLDLARPARVTDENVFHGGEPAFLRVLDADQNLDATRVDRLDVRVASAATGDGEVARLAETGPDTGEFTGWIPTRVGPAASGDCVLAVARASTIETSYVDAGDARDTARAEALVNPQGRVFDSRTGQPVSGARIRLVDAVTGLPAPVLGDDGRSTFPSEVTSGAQATDSGGTLYQFPPGTFRFPLLARAGSYRLVIEPPAGRLYPSTIAAAELQRLPGAPFLLAEGSFGRDYAVASPAAVTLDVPLDPVGGPLVVAKTASVSAAAIGDAVQYRVSVSNTGVLPVRGVVLEDLLPRGFRYARGSARLATPRDGERATEPGAGSDPLALEFRLGDLAPGASATLDYVARIGAGTPTGEAVNRAVARGERVVSNVAEAGLLVRDDLFRTRGFVLGRLTTGECGRPDGDGVANVRVYLQDGRYAVTDEGGRFHFEDLAAGAHAVQLDPTTVPDSLEAVACEGAASAREPHVRLVELRAGGLARAEFRLRARAVGGLHAPLGDEGTRDADDPDLAPVGPVLEQLPTLDSLPAGRAWLLPSAGFSPAVPAVHVAIQHGLREQVELTVNGAPASALLRDATAYDSRRTFAVARWRGVSLVEGENRLVAAIRDESGREVARLERTVAYGGAAVRAELDAEASRLVADGRTKPLLVVRLYDRFGHPARPGMEGTFRVDPPHRAWSEVESLRDNPLTAVAPRQPGYTVGADGRVRLLLEPTSQSGTAVVRLPLGEGRHEAEVRAWLAPAARDWILVGLAEGTGAWRRVNAHAEALPAELPAEGFEESGRVAFFAKGRIRGDYLLTLAYDSERRREIEDARVGGTIDPDAYYTLYGDATESRHDAPSQRKLYVKLERREFVALFGDFSTGFTVTELARYGRVLNGVRVEGGLGPVRAQAFVARGAQRLGRDVWPADGTSGPFRLRARGLVVGSEVVRVEVRERFRSEVLVSTRTLQRHLDYDLDWRDGVLWLKRPLGARDEDLNPVYLLAEYETQGTGGRDYTTAGARATLASADGARELGATVVDEGGPQPRRLGAFDARLRLGAAVELRVEVGRSESRDALDRTRAGAWLVEATRLDAGVESRLYAREQDAAFGLGQQAATEGGTRKVGGEARVRLTDRWSVEGQAYEQSALEQDASRRLAEAEVRVDAGATTGALGIRTARDERADARQRSDQLYAEATQDLYAGRVLLRAGAETALGGRDESVDFPTRARVGADYRLTPDHVLFADYERATGAGASAGLWRGGVRAEPWAGGQLESALNRAATEHGSRLYSSVGLTQGWRAGERWNFDVGVERADTLRGVAAPPLLGAVAGPGGYAGAGSAVAAAEGTTAVAGGALGRGGFALAPQPLADFTSAFAGAAFQGAAWALTGRVERYEGQDGERSTATVGAYREALAGHGFSAALRFVDADSGLGAATSADARLSWAWRRDGSPVLVLDRLDLVRETGPDATSTRFVNNLHVNVQRGARTQFGAQLGLRYADQRFGDRRYDGFARLYGADARHDLDARWDVGLQAARLETPEAGTGEWSIGADVGRRFGDRLWVSLGYNAVGFADRDFSRDRHTARGPYVRFRVHVDQDALRDAVERWAPGLRR